MPTTAAAKNIEKRGECIMQPMPITAYSAVTACGLGNKPLLEALQTTTSHLKKLSVFDADINALVGEVAAKLPCVSAEKKRFKTRNAQLALAALNCDGNSVRQAVMRAVEKYGADRVGVVLGTSTSGMHETELAYTTYLKSGGMPESFDFICQHAWGATADFLKEELGLQGPSYAISTACSSSSKSIASAQRLIDAGVCDAVLAGGVDSLCQLTLYGFSSLDLVADSPCTPLDENRVGISLGEGSGLLLLERPSHEYQNCLHLLGYGESSDAYHMTAPHPEGEGAKAAMLEALAKSGLKAEAIGYLNLHATGTRMNDASEMKAVEQVFPHGISCSGTKGVTGHTLGAAGAIESIISLLAIEHAMLPGTMGLTNIDKAFKMPVLKKTKHQKVNTVMTNNFGFGGNNASLIFGRLI